MDVHEINIERLVLQCSLPEFKKQTMGYFEQSASKQYILRALLTAASKGKTKLLSYLLLLNATVKACLNEHLLSILAASIDSNSAETITLLLFHANKQRKQQYLQQLSNFARHCISVSRISCLRPAVIAEQNGPLAFDVCSSILNIASQYGLATDLSFAHNLIMQSLNANFSYSLTCSAIEKVDGNELDVISKLTFLVDHLEQDYILYLTGLKNALVLAAKRNSTTIINALQPFISRLDARENPRIYSEAARVACSLTHCEVLQYILNDCTDFTIEERLLWKCHPQTVEMVLAEVSSHDLQIAFDKILKENTMAEQCPIHFDCTLRLSSCINQDPRELQYVQGGMIASKHRAAHGILASEMRLVCHVADKCTSQSINDQCEKCSICFEPLWQMQLCIDTLNPFTALNYDAKHIACTVEPTKDKLQNFKKNFTFLEVLFKTVQILKSQSLKVAMHGACESVASDTVIRYTNRSVLCLNCNPKHLFHSSCIYKWFERSQQCPICKFDFNPIVSKSLVEEAEQT